MTLKEQVLQLKTDFDDVYAKGKADGQAEGGDVSEIVSQFADTIQQRAENSQNRGTYNNSFLASNITETVLAKVMNAWDTSKSIIRTDFMFSKAPNIGKGLYTDKFDLSNARTARGIFSNSGVTKLKVIDVRKTESGYNGMANMFFDCKALVSIDEFYPSTKTNFSGTFSGCSMLKTVIFKSEISQDLLDLSKSVLLDKESFESVINQLSSTASGLTVTLSLTAVNNAFEGGKDGTDWQTLIATKPNWTIAYA